MADRWADSADTDVSPASRHVALAANAGADLADLPRAIYCEADGTITLLDELGTALPYTMTAGQMIPFRGVRVTAISGGTFYGWS